MKAEYKTSQLLPVTEKEKMLVAATLRMCRGEAGECAAGWGDQWRPSAGDAVMLKGNYRAIPQKLPYIPWEWLSDDVECVSIDKERRAILMSNSSGASGIDMPLKLNLDGVTLPCVVWRPE